MSAKHARLLILGSGPAGYTRGSIRRAREPQAGADHRSRAGRPADDDDRRRQLAGRRRRRAGARPDGALPAARRALRHRDRLRPHPHGATLRERPFRLHGRQRRVHLRCADHRHRRVGALPRPALRGGVHGQGRVGLRDLRRLLLQGRRTWSSSAAATPRSRKRSTCPTSRSSVTVVHRRDKFRAEAILVDRLMAKTKARRQHAASMWNHTLDEVLGDATRRHRRARQVARRRGATQDVPVHGVFIAIGHTPNTQIFEGQLDMAGGYIKVQGRHAKATRRRQRAGRVRRRRRRGPRLSPGRHVGRHRLHGGARRGGVPRSAALR